MKNSTFLGISLHFPLWQACRWQRVTLLLKLLRLISHFFSKHVCIKTKHTHTTKFTSFILRSKDHSKGSVHRSISSISITLKKEHLSLRTWSADFFNLKFKCKWNTFEWKIRLPEYLVWGCSIVVDDLGSSSTT
jgi:hypothetical protein